MFLATRSLFLLTLPACMSLVHVNALFQPPCLSVILHGPLAFLLDSIVSIYVLLGSIVFSFYVLLAFYR